MRPLVAAAIPAAVLAVLAVFLWLPVLRPPVSGRAGTGPTRPRAGAAPTHWFLLNDGGLVAGRLVSLDEKSAVVTTSWGKDLIIPRGELSGFSSSPLLLPRPCANPDDGTASDRLSFRTGGEIACVVKNVADGIMTVLPEDSAGRTRCFPLHHALLVVFGGGDIRAVLGFGVPGEGAGDRLVRIFDGGWIPATVLPGSDSGVRLLTRSLGKIEIPNRWVESITPRRRPSVVTDDAAPGYSTRLVGGNMLICAYSDDRVVEVTADGDEVWSCEAGGPVAARRLSTGNTLIAEARNNRLTEVNENGQVVWEANNLERITDCFRMSEGNTLYVTASNGGALVKIDYSRNLLWRAAHIPGPAYITRVTKHFVEIACARRTRYVYIDQMGGIIFDSQRRVEDEE